MCSSWEISNCRVWNTGHMYFTLKDGHSQVKAVMFRMPLSYLRFTPHDGLRVIARGGISATRSSILPGSLLS